MRDEVNEKVFSAKPPRDSEVETVELILPNDTNLLGNLLGGKLMHWMDITGAIAASRHSHSNVATATVDSIDFHRPIKQGELVKLQAKLTWVGKTSMEVSVSAFAENVVTGSEDPAAKAYFTFVAVAKDNRPKMVPPLTPETEQEKIDFIAAEERRTIRLARRKK